MELAATVMIHAYRVAVSKIRELVKRIRRSSHWRTVEKSWLRKWPECAGCGTSKRVQVHHVLPFHSYPQLELADGTGLYCPIRDANGKFHSNLISLCMDEFECHLQLGHLGSWKKDNPEVRRDAAIQRRRYA